MEKEAVGRAEPESFLFDGTGSGHYQGHRPPEREDRASDRQLAGFFSVDFDLWGRPVTQPLVNHLSSWLRKTKGA